MWLWFSQDASGDIFNGQGVDTIYEWLNLDNDDVKSLFRNIQKPSGGGQGEMISFKAEMNLHLTVFFIRHKHRTSGSVYYGDIYIPNICALKKQLELELAKERKPEASKIDLIDFSKIYEEFIQYLHGIRGYDGVPLIYVARPTSDMIPIVESEDPINAYATYDEEMVKMVLIIEPRYSTNATEEDRTFSDTFIGDKGEVWDIIPYVMDAWRHANISRNNREGRKDMLSLYGHFGGQTTWITYISRQR